LARIIYCYVPTFSVRITLEAMDATRRPSVAPRCACQATRWTR